MHQPIYLHQRDDTAMTVRQLGNTSLPVNLKKTPNLSEDNFTIMHIEKQARVYTLQTLHRSLSLHTTVI